MPRRRRAPGSPPLNPACPAGAPEEILKPELISFAVGAAEARQRMECGGPSRRFGHVEKRRFEPAHSMRFAPLHPCRFFNTLQTIPQSNTTAGAEPAVMRGQVTCRFATDSFEIGSWAFQCDHRQAAVLAHAIRHSGFSYNIAGHMARHGIVYDTARLDLLGLAERGLLEQRKAGKSLAFTVPSDLELRLRIKGGKADE